MNTELAHKVLDHITANPKTWNQEEWRCDSGMCYAGWAVTLSDAGLRWLNDDTSWVILPEGFPEVHYEWKEDGERRAQAVNVAEILLDIDNLSARRLFRSVNTLEDLREYVRILEETQNDPVLRDKLMEELAERILQREYGDDEGFLV